MTSHNKKLFSFGAAQSFLLFIFLNSAKSSFCPVVACADSHTYDMYRKALYFLQSLEVKHVQRWSMELNVT